MSDQRDEFYQPWLREPAARPASPVKRRQDGEASPGLSRDDSVPLGVDLSGYVLDEEAPPPPLPQRVKPAARAVSDGVARLAKASRKGALAFADWTIILGQRADVPARVAALEIPRRSGVALDRGGLMLSAASRAFAAATGRAGAAAAKDLGAAGQRARHAAGRVVDTAKAAAGRRFTALRSANAPVSPPDSGLDRLLANEQIPPPRHASDPSNLPLFAPAVAAFPAPTSPAPSAIVVPPATTVPNAANSPSSDERPARAAMPPPNRPVDALRGGGDFDAPPTVVRHWLPWVLAALFVLATTFWLGSRSAGGGMDRAEVEAIVRETILANPQIVPEAFERHQANQIAGTIDSIRPLLEKPFSGAWIGNAKGDVTLTIFTDYGCVFCRASVPDVDRLVREDKGVKVVFRELPIIAPQSKDAAIAALAAARQGKYDAFHHAMFAAPSLDRAAIDAASTRSGVILDGRSDANADVRLFEREIDNNLALAQQLGINGTPSWVVGSKLMQGAVGYGELKKAVAAARAAS